MATGLESMPSEFSTVIQIVNAYASVHCKDGKQQFISLQTTSRKTATIAAIEFAAQNQIPYADGLLYPTNLISVCKVGDKQNFTMTTLIL